MANKEINDLTASSILALTDNFEIQELAGLSKKASGQLIVNLVKNNFTSSTRQVFVSQTGSDVTGNGTEINPWASLPYAYSQITPGNSTRYQVEVLYGVYSWPTVAIKPFTYVNFNNSVITLASPATLDASWSGLSGAPFIWENTYLSNFALSLNFQTVGALGGITIFRNHSFNSLDNHSITGSNNDSTFLYLQDFSTLAPTSNLTILNCYGHFVNGFVNTFSHTANAIDANYTVSDVRCINNYLMLMAFPGGSTDHIIDSCLLEGVVTLSNISTGDLVITKTNTTEKDSNTSYVNSGGGTLTGFYDYIKSDTSIVGNVILTSLAPIYNWGKFQVYGESISNTVVAAEPAITPIVLTGAAFNETFDQAGISVNGTTGVLTNSTGKEGIFNITSTLSFIGVSVAADFEFMHVLDGTDIDNSSVVQGSGILPVLGIGGRQNLSIQTDIRLAPGQTVQVMARCVTGGPSSFKLLGMTTKVQGNGLG